MVLSVLYWKFKLILAKSSTCKDYEYKDKPTHINDLATSSCKYKY
jgi:hypothetical protein